MSPGYVCRNIVCNDDPTVMLLNSNMFSTSNANKNQLNHWNSSALVPLHFSTTRVVNACLSFAAALVAARFLFDGNFLEDFPRTRGAGRGACWLSSSLLSSASASSAETGAQPGGQLTFQFVCLLRGLLVDGPATNLTESSSPEYKGTILLRYYR